MWCVVYCRKSHFYQMSRFAIAFLVGEVLNAASARPNDAALTENDAARRVATSFEKRGNRI